MDLVNVRSEVDAMMADFSSQRDEMPEHTRQLVELVEMGSTCDPPFLPELMVPNCVIPFSDTA